MDKIIKAIVIAGTEALSHRFTQQRQQAFLDSVNTHINDANLEDLCKDQKYVKHMRICLEMILDKLTDNEPQRKLKLQAITLMQKLLFQYGSNKVVFEMLDLSASFDFD